MKVCTDACLFGAWVVSEIERGDKKIEKILDIGTGTGLLSLMLAQKTNANIDAVEIDDSAALQATNNFSFSLWKDRLKVYQTSIQQFSSGVTYDLIISNPPFFSNDLKSDDKRRNLALHSDALSLEELIKYVDVHLSSNGLFAVLLPYSRTDYLEKIVATYKSFFLQSKVLVKQTERHDYFRSMLLFSKSASTSSYSTNEIVIQNNNAYTSHFIGLLKDYYLHL